MLYLVKDNEDRCLDFIDTSWSSTSKSEFIISMSIKTLYGPLWKFYIFPSSIKDHIQAHTLLSTMAPCYLSSQWKDFQKKLLHRENGTSVSSVKQTKLFHFRCYLLLTLELGPKLAICKSGNYMSMSELPHNRTCCSGITLTPSLGSCNTPSRCVSGRMMFALGNNN